MQVREVLTHNVERIPPDTPVREAAQMMKTKDLGALPVYEGDRLIGMVTDRDIVTRAVAESRGPDTQVRDVMSQGVVYVFEDQDLKEAAKIMKEHQVRRLIVLNRDKRLVGIVSLGDLAVEGDQRSATQALKGVSQPAQAHH
jgi:CBS domain-containing protein